MAMRKPYKHKFRLRLHNGWHPVGPWTTASVRINRSWRNALQRVLREWNKKAPHGTRYVID